MKFCLHWFQISFLYCNRKVVIILDKEMKTLRVYVTCAKSHSHNEGESRLTTSTTLAVWDSFSGLPLLYNKAP